MEKKKISLIGKICIILAIVALSCGIIGAFALTSFLRSIAFNRGIDVVESLADSIFNDSEYNFSQDFKNDLKSSFSDNLTDHIDNIMTNVDSLTSDMFNASDVEGFVDLSKSMTFDPSTVRGIEIEMVGGEINLVPSTDGQLSVEYIGLLHPNWAKQHSIAIHQDGDEIKIKQNLKNKNLGLAGFKSKCALTVRVPSNIDVDIETVTSDINSTIPAYNSIDLEHVNGNIDFSKFTCTQMDIDGVNSEIMLDMDTQNPILDIDQVNGSVYLKLKAPASFEYKIDFINGALNIIEDNNITTKSKGSAEYGTFGDTSGSTGNIKVTSVNSEITIESLS